MGRYIGSPQLLETAEYMDWIPISKAVLAGHTTVSFSNITDDFEEYKFEFINIHAGTTDEAFVFQFNASGATGFDEQITAQHFKAEHSEGGSSGFGYTTANDQHNGTDYQRITYNQQNDTDESFSGELVLYDPANTTYHKHFHATGNYVHHSGHYSQRPFTAGYVNTTTAIDEISFMMESGVMDSGAITMYGLSK